MIDQAPEDDLQGDPFGHFYAIILSGGAGTRLWPLSRELSPKQILHLFGADSLIRQTIARLTKLVKEERIHIVTGQRLFDEIRNHLLTEFPPCRKVQYILEPAARNTAPAVALAAWQIAKQDPKAILGVFPSDHFITDDQPLLDAVRQAATAAKDGWLVTFGLQPERPETGFGYIERGEPLSPEPSLFRAARFIEKPDLETAKELVAAGRFFWNSGMFVFSARTLLEEVERFLPILSEVLGALDRYSPDERAQFAQQEFERIPPVSLDYGVMEKSERVAMIPVSLQWKDVGSLPALAEFHPKDSAENVAIGHIMQEGCRDSLLYSDSRLIAAIGLENMMVIDTPDATLVCPKERAQEVSRIVARLKEEKAPESVAQRYSHRPWGSYVELEKGSSYQVKHIEVYPGKRLSEQLHRHRSEHWIVLQGTAKVTIDTAEQIVQPNQSVYIPANAHHRLENVGKIPVHLIEVQNGEYLGEDDIVRFTDDFGR
ncbi:MAG: mannose-1-phosphate guanylyltransferase/mannose-6-phosphate isomerase [Coprothermobacterota bacterium]|nr:mannose-1-phosphate guanylyltransferase/mannose-6-phosphate isomerase [Coprothermobacterota bacterium]